MKKLLTLLSIVIGIGGAFILLPKEKIEVGNAATKFEEDYDSEVIEAYASTTNEGKIHQVKRFYTRQINYKTQEGWNKIDLNNCVLTALGYECRKMPFEFVAPTNSSESAIFNNNNRWNNLKREHLTDPELSLAITPENVVNVPVSYQPVASNQTNFVYSNAYSYGDLIYRLSYGKAPQMEKLIRIPQNPNFATDKTESWIYEYSDKVNFEKKDKTKWDETGKLKTNKDIKISVGNSKRGIGLKDFFIWDSSPKPKKIPVEVAIEKIGVNKYRLSKIIPASFFALDIIYPVYTDAVNLFFPEDADHGSLVDGRSCTYINTWAGARDDTDADAGDTSDIQTVGQGATAYGDTTAYQICREWFYTQSGDGIGADDNINEAKLAIYITLVQNSVERTTKNTNGEDFLFVSLMDAAANTAVATTDFPKFTDMNSTNPHGSGVEAKDMSSHSTTSTSYIDLTNITIDQYKEFAINATGTANITKGVGGVTKFGLMFGMDGINIQPCEGGTPCTAIRSYSISNQFAEGTNSPYLEVDFSSGTPAVAVADLFTNPFQWAEF